MVDGDTFPVVTLDEVTKEGKHRKRDAKEQERYSRLVRDVRKTLPYAKLAAFRMQLIENNLSLITDEKAKSEYLKRSEESLRKQFEEQLKNLTVSQGKLLLKLIYRETGKTTYNIVQWYRGNGSAVFWQSLARLFGSNLKYEYDPVQEYEIENIIRHLGFD